MIHNDSFQRAMFFDVAYQVNLLIFSFFLWFRFQYLFHFLFEFWDRLKMKKTSTSWKEVELLWIKLNLYFIHLLFSKLYVSLIKNHFYYHSILKKKTLNVQFHLILIWGWQKTDNKTPGLHLVKCGPKWSNNDKFCRESAWTCEHLIFL